MYVSILARLLPRPWLRLSLLQSRRWVFAIRERLSAVCLWFIPRIRRTPAMVVPSADSETKLPVATPLHTLEELKDRTLLSSPNLEFLKSSVALSRDLKRNANQPQLLVCHDYRGGYQEDKWVQGQVGMEGYVLWHWHLIDVFVYFSHSLVTVPPPGWINAAHKHGVPVLGTFITEWAQGASVCRSLLTSAETCCMYASHLAELADTLGFDGWLPEVEKHLKINIENNVDLKDLPRLHLFVQHLRQCMHNLVAHSIVLWYDAVTEEGKLDWQNCLNEKNRFFFGDSDGLFTNYMWREEMAGLSANAACERATDLYMGVDVFGRGTFGGGGFHCDRALKVARTAGVSAALFAPAWVYETNQQPSFEVAQNRWWRCIEDCWPVCRYNPTQLPFYSDFNQGCGNQVSVEGNEVSGQSWFNLSCQNLQPVLKVMAKSQHWVEERSLQVSISHQAAYSGGSCLRISGSVTLGLVELYEAHISVTGTPLHITHSVLADNQLHICLALHIHRKDSRFLALLVEEESDTQIPSHLHDVVIKLPVHNPDPSTNASGSGRWNLRTHLLELGTYTLNRIYAVVYSDKLEAQKLLSLVEEFELTDSETSSQSDTLVIEGSRILYGILGHLRIATSAGHDGVLPDIIFEGSHPEWTQLSDGWKSVSLILRWGLDLRGGQQGRCRWVQYYVYVRRLGLSGTSDSASTGDPEFLGVAIVQGFAVEKFGVPSSCNRLVFYVQGHCACGLPGMLAPCSVAISSQNQKRWTSDSNPSQPILSKLEDAV